MQKFRPIFTEDKPSGADDIVVIDINSEHFGLVAMNVFLDIDYPGINVAVKQLRLQHSYPYIIYHQPDIIEVDDIKPMRTVTNEGSLINNYWDWRKIQKKYKGLEF